MVKKFTLQGPQWLLSAREWLDSTGHGTITSGWIIDGKSRGGSLLWKSSFYLPHRYWRHLCMVQLAKKNKDKLNTYDYHFQGTK